MIRTLLTTTALVALLTAGAVAQDAAATSATTVEPFDLNTGYQAVDTDDLVSRLLGQPVYTGPASNAERIGDVNDLVIDQGGDIRAVIIGVGGFLGAGEKNVAADFSALKMVVAEDNTERWVLETTKEALDAAPAFEFIDDNPADTAANNAVDATTAPAADATTTADNNAMVTDNGAMTDTMVDRTTLSGVEAGALTAEELIGTRVVGPDDQQIAEVGDLVLTPDGQIDAVLVDFGGFLGIGEKRVAVAMNNLEFAADANGNRYVFLPGVTREQLDAAPAYNADTYANEPNQRVTMGM